MYNRYVTEKQYASAPFQEPFAGHSTPPPPPFSQPPPPFTQPPPGFGAGAWEETGSEDKKPNFFSGIFDFLKEKNIDTGDIILIALMILLFLEGGNIEVLIALGLLLVL